MELPLLFGLAVGACSGFVACVALWQESRAISSYLLAFGLSASALNAIVLGLAQSTHDISQVLHYRTLSLITQAEVQGLWFLLSLLYARGNALLFVKKWKLVWSGAFALPLALAWIAHNRLMLLALQPDGRLTMRLTLYGGLIEGVVLVTGVLGLTNLEHTFRAALGTIRWRLKYMILGLGVFFGVQTYASSQSLLYWAVDPVFATIELLGLALGSLLILRSLHRTVPGKIVTYPTRTVLLRSATIFVVGSYLLIVGVVAKIVVWLGDDASFQFKGFAILVSVLLVTMLAVSDRVRLHLRRSISRYLQKPLYDYRAVWRSFTEGVATEVNEAKLCEIVVALTVKTFELLSASIWLLDEKSETLRCSASTLESAKALEELQPDSLQTREMGRYFLVHPHPVAIEKKEMLWAEALRRCHPAEFRHGGDRVCVPLVAGGSFLGIILLADRIGGMPFSLQDFDLLRCVGDQVAASLLNARLSKRLLQNKEMEAFQTMSTFFVHDLKNLASTLNLMLKNLPVHFDNPEFRADALRGIGKTCDHINHLISRLSLLRESLQIRSAEADLNQIVASSASRCAAVPGVELRQSFQELPKIMVDSEQIDKVITNLTLNAIEAVGARGCVTLETNKNNGWAVLSVSDNGCGMDREFISRALFRPFQTTKKKGLGIGMFQSKMIVEAHGGRIEVESERGKGSTFRVLLPLPKTAE